MNLAMVPSWRSVPPSKVGITLETHVAQQMAMSPGATGHFTSLLYQITLAAKLVDSRVRQAGLADVLGWTGDVNVQGEQVQKLDEFANTVIIKSCEAGGHLCLMGSEEVDDPIRIPDQYPTGKYVLLWFYPVADTPG